MSVTTILVFGQKMLPKRSPSMYPLAIIGLGVWILVAPSSLRGRNSPM